MRNPRANIFIVMQAFSIKRRAIFTLFTSILLHLAAASHGGGRPLDMEAAAALLRDPPNGGALLTCERVTTKLCEHMPYKQTRMPNFFGDMNQYEAQQRALDYVDLVDSRCSPDLTTYLCELLNPICMEKQVETMRRFEIYPCRSVCRRVWRDCERQLSRSHGLSGSLLGAFQCDKLPFEMNEGNSSLSGPCHETQAPARPPQGHYQPYEPGADFNKPPFITDTSPLGDSGAALIKPPLPPPIPPPAQPNPSLTLAQPQPPAATPTGEMTADGDPTQASRGNNSLWAAAQLGGGWLGGLLNQLAKYSNQLSVATLVCLLLVLNLRRLRRWTSAASQHSSRASSSCASGKHLASYSAAISGQPAINTKLAGSSLSPSSSSRSLVMFTSGGKTQHKLIPAEVEPQRLLLNTGLHQSQKTLINVNGTLERGGGGHHHRYLVMQPATATASHLASDKQHLFGAAAPTDSGRSSCHSNQYDYIQVQTPQQQQQQQHHQQLYSNILLSSPSHQVLLMGGNNGGGLNGPPPPQQPPPPPSSTCSSSTTAAHHFHHPNHSHHPARPLTGLHSPRAPRGGAAPLDGHRAAPASHDEQRSFQRRRTMTAASRQPRPFGPSSWSSSSGGSSSTSSPPDGSGGQR